MKSNVVSLKRIIKQLSYILTDTQRRAAIVVAIMMIISSGLELLGVSAIFPFLQMMTMPATLKQKWYIAWIYRFIPSITEQQVLIAIGIVIIALYLLKNGFVIICGYVQSFYAAKVQREMSTFLLDSYMKRPYQFFLSTNSSEIYRGITGDVSGVYQILLAFFQMCTELITIFLLGVFLLMTDFVMAFGATLLAVLCFCAIIMGFKGKMKTAGQRNIEADGMSNKYGYQAINGIKEITVLGRRENFVKQYNEAVVLRQSATAMQNFISLCPDRIIEGMCIGGFIGIICIRIGYGADLTQFIPVLGAFAMAAFKILPSISKVSYRINTIVFYQENLKNAYDNLKESRRYEEETRKYNKEYLKDGDGVKSEFRNALEIKNVSWKYQNAQKNVLNRVSLKINKGESVALIGASGAGKSTLADIIMGLFKPQEGTVEMDGVDIFAIPQVWAKIIGYVPQSVFLIDDSVRKNVAFGLDNSEISDEQVWRALAQAQLKEFIELLPYGLDTIVGERGVKFSGGQRQRIAIARALYNEPEILILDEATAALDNETETAVMESIEFLQGQVTLIIVAHRLTTIKNCDVIYEIKDGNIVLRDKVAVLDITYSRDNSNGK